MTKIKEFLWNDEVIETGFIGWLGFISLLTVFAVFEAINYLSRIASFATIGSFICVASKWFMVIFLSIIGIHFVYSMIALLAMAIVTKIKLLFKSK